jgi:serine/threonine-protein kinase
MAIESGQQLLHYRLTEKIGEGGMGVVWKAVDTTLDREVAVKILPDSFAADPERLARFGREAKLLASLNHPNVAAIYGIHEHAGRTHFLAMELIDGEDLQQRMTRGPLPNEEALRIALEIAHGFEAAHARGIIHRDLKPANVRLSQDGGVKVLDFGLAKAMMPDVAGESSASSMSPTMTSAGTIAGMILGTASYMSPEQAKGKPVDRRADIWSFGVVLFELFSGRRLFDGETISETLAAVLLKDPDWSALPANTPAKVRRLLQRCLTRDPKNRLQDIGEARIALQEVLAGDVDVAELETTGSASSRSRRGYAVLALFALLIVSIIAAIGYLRPVPELSRPVRRFAVELPKDAPFAIASYPGHALAISRDGSVIAYETSGDGPRLKLRRLDDLEIQSIAGTERNSSQPFFSPDGNWVGTFGNELVKVPLKGGQPVTLARDLAGGWFRGSWSDDDRIVYDTWNGGLRVVSADGGPSVVLTQPTDEWHLGPQMLPGSTTFLFFVQTATTYRIESMSLDGTARHTVLENASHPVYLASGHLQFVRDGSPMVVPFDVDALKLTGSPVPLDLEVMVDHVNVGAPIPQLAVSVDGTLVYAPRSRDSVTKRTLVWVDREGNTEEFTTVPFPHPHFQLSRDGSRLALSGRNGADVHYEILDVERKTLNPLRKETLDYPVTPIWSNDGSRIYFPRFGTHESQLFSQVIDGGAPESLLTIEGTWLAPIGSTPDERYVVFFVYHPVTAGDIWYLDREAKDGEDTLQPFLADANYHDRAALSPDGHWLAYVGHQTEESEVYIRRFPSGDSQTRVSSAGGYGPLWAPDGGELYYRAKDGTNVMAVTFEAEPTLRLGDPRLLFTGNFQQDADVGSSWAIHPDGKRFLMAVQEEDLRQASRLVVVENWFAEIEELLGR